MNSFNDFVRDLYCSGSTKEIEAFRPWALKRLRDYIPFDSAIWGTGDSKAKQFHSVATINLPENFTTFLEHTREINPIFPALLQSPEKALRLEDITSDDTFYDAPIYQVGFKRFSIERILCMVMVEPRSRLRTLIGLNRSQRNRPFSQEDVARIEQAGYHLLHAYAHVFDVKLIQPPAIGRHDMPLAVCDSEGNYHHVQERFLNLMERYYPGHSSNRLPFPCPNLGKPADIGELHVEVKSKADLLCVYARPQTPLDKLTLREQTIAHKVSHGLTFKEIARDMDVAPSTVSNHLYRIYKKLGIISRNDLAKIVHQNT